MQRVDRYSDPLAVLPDRQSAVSAILYDQFILIGFSFTSLLSETSIQLLNLQLDPTVYFALTSVPPKPRNLFFIFIVPLFVLTKQVLCVTIRAETEHMFYCRAVSK